MTMAQLDPGQIAVITEVGGHGSFRRRLMEMGVLPGTTVVRTGQAPFGDPLSFRVRHAVLSLRRTEAATVGVEIQG